MAVYANSAQVLRLVHAALYRNGGRVVSTSGGRVDCAEIVIQTMSTNEPKVILPCTGDRVFGMAQDTEMVFAFPWCYVESKSSKDLKEPTKAASAIRSPWPCGRR